MYLSVYPRALWPLALSATAFLSFLRGPKSISDCSKHSQDFLSPPIWSPLDVFFPGTWPSNFVRPQLLPPSLSLIPFSPFSQPVTKTYLCYSLNVTTLTLSSVSTTIQVSSCLEPQSLTALLPSLPLPNPVGLF